MNTYKIIFTRENGTQGTDHFTAANERQARKDFGEIAKLKARIQELLEDSKHGYESIGELASRAGEAQRRAEAAEAEVIRLKAKLYDYMTRED